LEQKPKVAGPSIFVSKWADFTEKYGLAYLLSSSKVGMFFNDGTKMITEHSEFVHYIYKKDITSSRKGGKDRNEIIEHYNLKNYPESMRKKCILFIQFKEYLIR
jgi:hypothetical protein